MLGYPGGLDPTLPPSGVVLALQFRHGGTVLSLFSITAIVGTATDVMVGELAIECFYPADAATARVLSAAGEGPDGSWRGTAG